MRKLQVKEAEVKGVERHATILAGAGNKEFVGILLDESIKPEDIKRGDIIRAPTKETI